MTLRTLSGYEKETISKPLEQPAFADNKHDNAIVEVSGFFCHACVMDKPATEASPDPRYCQGCYDFLTKEAKLLDGRKPTWVPKDSQSITRTPLEPSCKPIQPASGVGHNYIDTPIGSGIMSTVESKKDDGKRGRKHKTLPWELISQWAGEGMGSRVIASKLKSELGIKVSYKTVQRLLSGEREFNKHGESNQRHQSQWTEAQGCSRGASQMKYAELSEESNLWHTKSLKT